MQAEKLMHGEYHKARALWREMFAEDTEKYLDYYDENISPCNEVYVTRSAGEAVSMLHLNPYPIRMGAAHAHAHFLVAGATREGFRLQGRMAAMLHQAFHVLYEKKEPFTYFTPAVEKMYLPFGCRTVAMQEEFALRPRDGIYTEMGSEIRCRPMEGRDVLDLAAFSSDLLSARCMVYADRSVSYIRRCKKEQEAMDGGILLFYRGDALAGYCFTGAEDGAEAWEIALLPREGMAAGPEAWEEAGLEAVGALSVYFSDSPVLRVKGFLPGMAPRQLTGEGRQSRPGIMARIVHLASFVERLTAKERVEFEFSVQDEILRENNGAFRFTITPEGGGLALMEKAARAITIGELANLFFGKSKAFSDLAEKINTLHPVWFTELA